MEEKDVQIKGEAMLSIPIFIIKKFGKDKFRRWLDMLSPEAKKVFSNPIAKGDWFPISMMIEATQTICDLFYNGSMRGAWSCGRYSAEYGLKGVYKVLVKLRSPLVLIKKAESILPTYYRPCRLEIEDHSDERVVLRVLHFPGLNELIEHRIGGWMERAIEITGCKHVNVKINHTAHNYKPVTEYSISWKKGF